MKHTKHILLCSILLLGCLVLTGCTVMDSDHYPDVVYPLPSGNGSLIFREESFLLGSRADCYYKPTKGKEVLLGIATLGDDGYCPIQNGKYSVTENGNTVTVSYYNGNAWEDTTFELPN